MRKQRELYPRPDAPRAERKERRSMISHRYPETPMDGHQHDSTGSNDGRGFRISGKWVLLGFIAIAGYFLLTEHRAHAIQFLPVLLLLACPLLHMFHGHGGHGGQKDGDGRGGDSASRRERTEGDSQ
jgi:hypothetical protein